MVTSRTVSLCCTHNVICAEYFYSLEMVTRNSYSKWLQLYVRNTEGFRHQRKLKDSPLKRCIWIPKMVTSRTVIRCTHTERHARLTPSLTPLTPDSHSGSDQDLWENRQHNFCYFTRRQRSSPSPLSRYPARGQEEYSP